MRIQLNAQEGDRSGLLLILCSAVLWGTVGVFVQSIYAATATNALSIAFLRLAISVPVLLLVCARTLGRKLFQIDRQDWARMLLMGAMLAFYQVSFFAAIPYIGVAASTLITLCTAPVWVAILASMLLRERLTSGVGLAGVCAIAGTLLLVNLEPSRGAGNPLIGVGFALSSALGYAVVALCGRQLAGRCHPLQSLTIGVTVATVLLFPLVWTVGLVLNYSKGSWLALLYLGMIPTALAYLLYFRGMVSTRATTASIATLLEPLTSTLLAWWLLQEQLSASGWVGAGLLLLAIGFLYWENRRWLQKRSR